MKEKDIDLENLVFYRDETHYFVMTAKKPSLLKKGVLKADCEKNCDLLSPDNVSVDNLKLFVREVANYCKLPEHCALAKGQMGLDDIGMYVVVICCIVLINSRFDFSRKLACTKPAKVLDHPASPDAPCLVAVVCTRI